MVFRKRKEIMMTDGVVERSRPRDRILETARDMFHKHGIKGVGVDAITEAAGTNKMTLYRHFDSKARTFLSTWSQLDHVRSLVPFRQSLRTKFQSARQPDGDYAKSNASLQSALARSSKARVSHSIERP